MGVCVLVTVCEGVLCSVCVGVLVCRCLCLCRCLRLISVQFV